MVAKLPTGGRIVNYDPQTYSSYPGSPQGVPDLNIIPGLPSVSGYASIVNGNYESTTHTHEQDDLDIGELSSGTLGRLDLREIVTVPEYFLVPLQATPQSFDDFTQTSENFGTDPVLARGYGANFNDTAYPFDPGPRPALETGKTASWFYGETLEPESATLVLQHPRQSGNERALRRVARRRVDALGRPGPGARRSQHCHGSASGGGRHRAVGPGGGGLAPAAAGGDLRGRTSLRALGLAVVGARPGTLAVGRVVAGLCRLHAPQAGGACRGHHRATAGGCPCRFSRAPPSQRTSGCRPLRRRR